jgi:adenosylcobinamide-GDP ribazoletransferase
MREPDLSVVVDHFNAWIDDLGRATALLTRVPMPHRHTLAPEGLARAQRAFPLVGAIIGLTVGLVDLALRKLGVPALTAAALALGASAAFTGALHEDGLADVGDGFGGGRDRAAKLAIMRDSRLGSYGALVLLVSFAAKWSALASLPSSLIVAGLVVAHALGRAAIPALAASLPFARADGLGQSAGRPEFATAVMAIVIALVIALVCLPPPEAVLAAVVTAAVAVVMAFLAWRQIGGVTGDVFGAVEQAAETAVLVMLAARLA